MITNIEDYFEKGCGRCSRFDTPHCSTRPWIQGLLNLRQICRDEGLEEHLKWAHPTYMHAGRNICVIGAFRADFRISFFEAALMKDPEGMLERQGPNTKHPDMIRFDDVAQVADRSVTIRSYLQEAMTYAASGIKAPREPHTVDIPEELSEAMDADPELAEAFHGLTPGRQKGYAINLNSAKKPETRIARIAKFRDRIIAGKGAQER